jgi:hypothetical protein
MNESSVRYLVRLLGVRILEACPDPGSLDWVLVETANELRQKILLLERTYREGTRVVVDPTDDEIAACRIDSWRVWNTKRAVFLLEVQLGA